MEVVPFDPSFLRQARELYNRIAQPLPYALPAAEEEFSSAFERPPSMAGHPFRLAAVEGGRLWGFASGAVNLDGESERVARVGDGVLHTFFTESGAAAAALLKSTLGRFEAAGVERIVAFDAGEPVNRLGFFDGGFPAWPEQIPGTLQALALAGFTVAVRELNLTRDLTLEDAAEAAHWQAIRPGASGVRAPDLRWQPASPDHLRLAAFSGSERVGTCNGFLMSTIQSHPEAALRGYIDWLGVEPEHQRQGIGRLLLATMLTEMRQRGLRRVFLSTGSQNWRAQPLYLSFGFLVTGTAVTMVRSL